MEKIINLSQFDSLAAISSNTINKVIRDLEVKGGVITITIGTTKPSDNSIWLDTTGYTSNS